MLFQEEGTRGDPRAGGWDSYTGLLPPLQCAVSLAGYGPYPYRARRMSKASAKSSALPGLSRGGDIGFRLIHRQAQHGGNPSVKEAPRLLAVGDFPGGGSFPAAGDTRALFTRIHSIFSYGDRAPRIAPAGAGRGSLEATDKVRPVRLQEGRRTISPPSARLSAWRDCGNLPGYSTEHPEGFLPAGIVTGQGAHAAFHPPDAAAAAESMIAGLVIRPPPFPPPQAAGG